MKKKILIPLLLGAFILPPSVVNAQSSAEYDGSQQETQEKHTNVKVNYSNPQSSDYVAPPIFPFPDTYTLTMPDAVNVENMQVHPPIFPYPHRMQYDVEQDLSGKKN